MAGIRLTRGPACSKLKYGFKEYRIVDHPDYRIVRQRAAGAMYAGRWDVERIVNYGKPEWKYLKGYFNTRTEAIAWLEDHLRIKVHESV